MSDLRLVGAVGIKVRPDTRGFREDTQRGINKELGTQGEKVEAKAKVKVDADTKQAEVKVSKFEKEVDGKTLTLNVGLDHDSVQRARQQIDQALKSLDNNVFKFGMDRPSLERVKAELEKLAKNAKVEFEFIQDEAGYKSVLDKIKKIRNERDLKTMWKFGTDEKSLKEAEAKANAAIARMQAEKTIDIRYSDNYDGMKRAIAELDAQLEDIRKLRITTKLDEASLEAARAEMLEMMQFAEVTVKFNEDKQGYEQVLSRIRAIQREKLEKEITFKTDDESLREEAAKYEALIDAANQRAEIAARFAPVTIEYNEDLKGYQDALAHIKRIQREKIVKKLELVTDPESIAAEVAKFEALVAENTPPKTVDFKYRNDRTSLQAAIETVKAQLLQLREVEVKVNLDPLSLAAEQFRLQEILDRTPLKMKIAPDKAGYESVLQKIAEIRRQKTEKEISFRLDDADLEKTEKEIKEKLDARIREVAVKFRTALDEDDLEEAKRQAEHLKEHIDHMKASMQVELAGAELTAARLTFLGRDRVVNYIARVNERSMAVAEGMLKSIGGLNTFGSIGKTLEGIFTKFDNYSLKMTALATAAAGVVNTLTYLGTAAFRVGEGMVQSIGVLAAAPAVLGAATVGYTIFTAAFNNFFDAFNKDPIIAKSALAALPPLARKTVDSITGLYKGLANPIQEKFWARVGTTLSDSIEQLYPKLKVKLLESTEAVGDFVAGFGKSMNKLALSDDFDRMFAGFNGFFVNLSGASEPFFDAWNRFGVQGSSLLPQFGQWIKDMAVRFDDWSKSLGENGIIDMIMHGVHSLQTMWAVGGDVVDIFKAITRAAGLAGTGGLAEFHINLRKVADTMLSEPWQSKAAAIFEGARKGASELNGGFKDLVGTLGDSSVWLGTVLTQLGDIGGNVLTGLSDLLGSQKYQDGITAELKGVQDLTASLRPSFLALGDVIGDMGLVAGSVFSEMGPVINQFTKILADATATISDNLAAVAPKFLATISGILRVAAPLVQGLADGLNSLLGLLRGVPNSFVLMGVAAAAFFAMRGLASKFFDSFKQTGTFKNLEANWLAQQVAAGKTTDKLKMVNGEMQKFTVPTEKFSSTRAAFDTVRAGAGNLQTQFRDLNGVMQRMDGTTSMANQMRNLQTVAMPGLKTAASGLMSFIGGGWGLVFMGAAAAIGIFAQAQSDSKQHVEALTAAIDKQTGKMNEAGLKEIAKRWTDIGEAQDIVANAQRGVTKAANETFDRLGLSIPETTTLIAQGGDAAKEYAGKWKTLGVAMGAVELGKFGGDMDKLRSTAETAANALGLNVQQIEDAGVKGNDLTHVYENLNDEVKKVDVSRMVFEGLAASTGTTTVAAQQMAGAMQTIGDNSLTAAAKIGAINRALDLLKGGKLSAREAEANAASAQQQAVQQAASIREELAATSHLFDGTTKMLDLTAPAGLKLYQAMETSANGIKIAAQAAYDAALLNKKTPEQAMAAAQAVISGGNAKLEEIAKNAGVAKDKIQKDWESFFGTKWQLNATFSASADNFQAIKDEVTSAGIKWDESVFEAYLAANGDPSKHTVAEAEAWAKKYANDKYEAQLKAMNPQALEKILQATGQADNYKKGDYTAVMKALNGASPGAQAAFQTLMGVKGGPGGAGWFAAFKAFMDAASARQTDADLRALANRRRVATIAVQYSDGGAKPGTGGKGLAFVNAYGSLSDGKGGFPGGFRPQVKMFADGGIENHVAQIAYKSPQVPFRIWAEAEGGEAYIPLAASKRQRSTQILSEVAGQFGLRLSPAHGQAFADGGVVGAGSRERSNSVAVNIDSYIQQSENTADDVARAIMRRVKARGVYAPLEGF